VHARFEHVERERGDRDRGFDARVDLHIADQLIMLLIEVRKTVYPRDVRQVLWQLRELGHRNSRSRTDYATFPSAKSCKSLPTTASSCTTAPLSNMASARCSSQRARTRPSADSLSMGSV
jgi:hypothetical protein